MAEDEPKPVQKSRKRNRIATQAENNGNVVPRSASSQPYSQQGQNKPLEAKSGNYRTGGRDGGGEVSDFSPKDYINASMKAFEARTDARFLEVIADLKVLTHLAQAAPSRWTIWTAVFSGAGIILAVALAVLAYGGDATEARNLSRDNADQIRNLADVVDKQGAQIDALMELLRKQSPTGN